MAFVRLDIRGVGVQMAVPLQQRQGLHSCHVFGRVRVLPTVIASSSMSLGREEQQLQQSGNLNTAMRAGAQDVRHGLAEAARAFTAVSYRPLER